MAQREALEDGYKQFKIGVMLQEARIKQGMTQQELANMVGTTKFYISKIENNIKEARQSTLQKIVELGFGGKVELIIHLGILLAKEKLLTQAKIQRYCGSPDTLKNIDDV